MKIETSLVIKLISLFITSLKTLVPMKKPAAKVGPRSVPCKSFRPIGQLYRPIGDYSVKKILLDHYPMPRGARFKSVTGVIIRRNRLLPEKKKTRRK